MYSKILSATVLELAVEKHSTTYSLVKFREVTLYCLYVVLAGSLFLRIITRERSCIEVAATLMYVLVG